MTLACSTILQDLRLQTAGHHRKLETEAGIWASLCSLSAYRDLIVRMCGIYTALEFRLKTRDDLSLFLPDLHERWKAPLLEQDLTALGVQSKVSAYDDVPTIDCAASAFGCFYVIEGSTLGGQMISREVSKHLGFTGRQGCAFFSSYGHSVGRMWEVFGECLNSYCSAYPASHEQIVGAAAATFECFTRHLSRETADIIP